MGDGRQNQDHLEDTGLNLVRGMCMQNGPKIHVLTCKTVLQWNKKPCEVVSFLLLEVFKQ